MSCTGKQEQPAMYCPHVSTKGKEPLIHCSTNLCLMEETWKSTRLSRLCSVFHHFNVFKTWSNNHSSNSLIKTPIWGHQPGKNQFIKKSSWTLKHLRHGHSHDSGKFPIFFDSPIWRPGRYGYFVISTEKVFSNHISQIGVNPLWLQTVVNSRLILIPSLIFLQISCKTNGNFEAQLINSTFNYLHGINSGSSWFSQLVGSSSRIVYVLG